MSFLSLPSFFEFHQLFLFLITLIILLAINHLYKFYSKISSLPPGPFPFPIVVLRFTKHFVDVIKQIHQRYGPVFTFWVGNVPLVVIADIDLAREAFLKSDFMGRTRSYFGGKLSNDERRDVAFCDYGHEWKALRGVMHSAIKKYSASDKITPIAINCVDNIVKTMIEKEGVNKEFNPANYNYLIFLNIMASTAFGISYSAEDDELKKLQYLMQGFGHEVGARLMLWEFSPILRFIDKNLVHKFENLLSEVLDCINTRYIRHCDDYDPDIERDFCDALIAAKNQDLRENKESIRYLKDENLAAIVFDLIFAGTDTSYLTFHWILLLLAYYPEHQKQMRQEVVREIGGKTPKLEDKSRCHFIMAFIAESMRFRIAVPFIIPHKTVVSSKIGGYGVPQGITVLLCLGIILMDKNIWPNAHQFIPERFIENGIFNPIPHKAYIPFSFGRRRCIGYKLAIADLFLVLVRYLQLTSDYNIVLGSNEGIEPDPYNNQVYAPKKYKIIFQKAMK